MKTILIREKLLQAMPQMHRVALRMTGREEAAKDIVQDAVVQILKSSDKLRDISKFSSWAYSITVNSVRSHWRQNKRHKDKLEAYEQRLAFHQPIHADQLDNLVSREKSDNLREILGNFPKNWQDAFVLTQLDGYSYDEAAEILNLSRGTLASSVARVKSKILENHKQLFAE